ncbi:hypothetical protein OJAV_G00084030 [Oryzias javanicus]|uniref:Uncharacterized protein n=1 Tax=Oryzias javanicus TaxID=123683 RepID=A0A437D5V4_ORYJA|nr:hypothetical protein OJAV_G00084030 [Oryzias javanicus]
MSCCVHGRLTAFVKSGESSEECGVQREEGKVTGGVRFGPVRWFWVRHAQRRGAVLPRAREQQRERGFPREELHFPGARIPGCRGAFTDILQKVFTETEKGFPSSAFAVSPSPLVRRRSFIRGRGGCLRLIMGP